MDHCLAAFGHRSIKFKSGSSTSSSSSSNHLILSSTVLVHRISIGIKALARIQASRHTRFYTTHVHFSLDSLPGYSLDLFRIKSPKVSFGDGWFIFWTMFLDEK